MPTKIQRLPPELRNLCSRLAFERTKPQAWALGAALRHATQERLSQGVPAEQVAKELQNEIDAAGRTLHTCLVQARRAHEQPAIES